MCMFELATLQRTATRRRARRSTCAATSFSNELGRSASGTGGATGRRRVILHCSSLHILPDRPAGRTPRPESMTARQGGGQTGRPAAARAHS